MDTVPPYANFKRWQLRVVSGDNIIKVKLIYFAENAMARFLKTDQAVVLLVLDVTGHHRHGDELAAGITGQLLLLRAPAPFRGNQH